MNTYTIYTANAAHFQIHSVTAATPERAAALAEQDANAPVDYDHAEDLEINGVYARYRIEEEGASDETAEDVTFLDAGSNG